MRIVIFVLLVLLNNVLMSECGSIWPLPRESEYGSTSVKVDSSLSFNSSFNDPLIDRAIARYKSIIFNTKPLFKYSNSKAKINVEDDNLPSLLNIFLNISSSNLDLSLETDQSYTLSINLNNNMEAFSTITAVTAYGAIYGLESLSQLINNTNNNLLINNCPLRIVDSPRFAHRGILYDSSRWFISVDEILRQLDAMAYSKLNVFHWHLTDSQSFPLFLPSLPNLSAQGAYSNEEIYSLQDIQLIINQAKDRGIRVIPEIDAPGHTTSWGKAFENLVVCNNVKPWTSCANEPPCGQLDPTSEEVYSLLKQVWSDMTNMFPDIYFHAGADEVNFNCWNMAPSINEYKASHNNISNNDLLQMFEDREHSIIRALGKNVINWEEVILDFNLNINSSTLIQVWKGSSSVKPIVEKGYKVIASPANQWYLDCGEGEAFGTAGGVSWCDPYKTWETIYSYNPVEGLDEGVKNLVIGGEVAVWSETIDQTNLDPIVWPRASAAAERLWSEETVTNMDSALVRINEHRQLLVNRGIRARPLQPEYCTRNPGQC